VVTGKNTASNYGTETWGEVGRSPAVFKESPEGPFWSNPDNKELVRTNSGYLLTKTHCGNYCSNCSPREYLEPRQTFTRKCLEGDKIIKDENGEAKKTLVSYSSDRVKRAVHLLRDPFDNIVSRFHLEYNEFVQNSEVQNIVRKNETQNMTQFPKSRVGFLAFCRDKDRRFGEEEGSTVAYRDVFADEAMRNVPCRADFYRYIQWHNLAATTLWDLRLPTLVLHYENYTHNFDRTKELLLEFLEQEDVHEPPPFVTGKSYREYFTEAEIRAVSSMFSTLAMANTWELTKHYFTY